MSGYSVRACKAKSYNSLVLIGETSFRIIFAKIPNIVIISSTRESVDQ